MNKIKRYNCGDININYEDNYIQVCLSEDVEKLEKQNEELIKFLKNLKDRISDFEYDVNQQSFLLNPIEEIIKQYDK